jgi:hypothetical protein
MSWNEAEVISFVRAQLGHPKRVIELDDTQIKEAIKRAVRKWSTTIPNIRKGYFQANSGQQAYNLTTLGKEFGKGVIMVYPEPITSPQAVYNDFEYYRLRQPPYVDMGELVVDQIYYREIGILTGTDFDWHWDEGTTTILLKPIPSRSFVCAYDYNDPPDTIDEVPVYSQGWVVDYTLALSKEMLGRVRDKFKGVPGNDLPVETDGADLISEGQSLQEELKETLWTRRGDWTPPIRG